MTIENYYSFYLLMICNGILAAAASITILRFQRMMKEQKSFWESPTGATLASQPKAQPQPDQDDFLRAVENRFAHLEEGIGKLSSDNKPASGNHKNLPYENAVRMARHGANVDDLTRTCGLSDIEARLLMRVHGNSTTDVRLN